MKNKIEKVENQINKNQLKKLLYQTTISIASHQQNRQVSLNLVGKCPAYE